MIIFCPPANQVHNVSIRGRKFDILTRIKEALSELGVDEEID